MDGICVREQRTSASGEGDTSDIEGQNAMGRGATEQVGSRQEVETERTKLLVLLGSGILQLPIWGFAMSYGVFQEYHFDHWTLEGDRSITGAIGTTANGVMYLSMPVLFALFARRWAHRRRPAALGGTALASAAFLASSYSTRAWHLAAAQGVAAALGGALAYSPATLSLGEWWHAAAPGGRGGRALAYGLVLSCKNAVGTGCPFLLRALLDRCGLRTTLRAWAAVVAATGVLGVLLVPTPPPSRRLEEGGGASTHSRRARGRRGPGGRPWRVLRHRSVYFYGLAIAFQSAGYGVPQTYLGTYARDVALLPPASGTLLLALFNAPGIVASSFFGWLSDNERVALSAQAVSAIPPLSSAVCTFLFWGPAAQGGLGLLLLFSITFGFFSSGYSATWGGMLKQMERESEERDEAVDAGMLYGLLNGLRGIGYVGGGIVGMELLRADSIAAASHRFGYGTSYGPLIVFTGLSSLLGGWVVLWRWNPTRLLPLVWKG